jgi:hypothetical protein
VAAQRVESRWDQRDKYFIAVGVDSGGAQRVESPASHLVTGHCRRDSALKVPHAGHSASRSCRLIDQTPGVGWPIGQRGGN